MGNVKFLNVYKDFNMAYKVNRLDMTLTSLRLYQVYGNSYSTTVRILLHLGPKRITLRTFITFRAKTYYT